MNTFTIRRELSQAQLIIDAMVIASKLPADLRAVRFDEIAKRAESFAKGGRA